MKTGCQTTTKVLLLHQSQSFVSQHQQKSESGLYKHQNTANLDLVIKKYNLDAIYADSKSTAQELLNILNGMELSVPSLHVAEQLKEIGNSAYQLNHAAENYLAHQFRTHQLVSQLWQKILRQNSGKTVAVVTTKETHQVLIGFALGLSSERYHVLQQSSQGFSILNFTNAEEKSAQLTAFNTATHLGTNLPQIQTGKKGLLLLLLAANTPQQQLESIAEFLQPESLNYILSGDLNQAASVTEKLLLEQPKALHLQVLRNDFPEIWQHALLSRQTPMSQEEKQILVTGLVIANETILTSLLEQVFGNQPTNLAPDSLAVIHYPPGNQLPILDTLISSETLQLELARCE